MTSGLDIEELVLLTLNSVEVIHDTWQFALENNIDHQIIVGAVKSLLTDRYVIDEQISTSFWILTDEGNVIVQHGSPEFQVLNSVPTEGIALTTLQNNLGDVCKVGLGQCLKNKWLKKEGDLVVRLSNMTLEDDTLKQLSLILNNNAIGLSEDDLKNLKRRKLAQQLTRKSYKITKGPEYRTKRIKKVADITKEMLGNKSEVNYFSVNLSCLYNVYLF